METGGLLGCHHVSYVSFSQMSSTQKATFTSQKSTSGPSKGGRGKGFTAPEIDRNSRRF